MKFRSSLALLVVAAVAAACYNDSDTNLTELRDNLDITYAIAGRFTIYPPEYYQRRIEIQTANLKKNPNDLNAYDNLAVAYDRIGKHDEAIATIRKERALLEYSGVNPLTEVKDELVPDAPPVNHRYTVEANEGTFLIHRWISNGGNPKNLTDAVEADKHIAKAIEINPIAHFGSNLLCQWGSLDPLVRNRSGSRCSRCFRSRLAILQNDCNRNADRNC
jgi:tetratricopeptide (TPR) repeat protein